MKRGEILTLRRFFLPKTEQMKLLEEHESQMAQAGDQTADTDISTGRGGLSLDPLKFVLYPLQQYLALACKTIRFIKNVVIWDEPYIAFILTFVFFGIGFVLLFVPWMFLYRWTARLVAWLLLGPQMRFADIYWYRKFEEMTEDERAQQIRDGLKTQLEAARALASVVRIQKEDAVKLRDVRNSLYGRLPKVTCWSSVRSSDEGDAHFFVRALQGSLLRESQCFVWSACPTFPCIHRQLIHTSHPRINLEVFWSVFVSNTG
jgi:hypothetical protein